MKKLLFCLGILFLALTMVQAQKASKINVEYSDFADINQTEIPDALLLRGNVRVSHEGVVFTCNKAYFFQKENYLKAFGDVQMVQGDTLYLNSKYAEYNGEVKQAYATGNVVMRSPESTLVTDTINFDRKTQQAFYNSNGTITSKENTLKSKSGRYYANEKKFRFLTTVTITNPKYTIKSDHLDYYTKSGQSFLLGPSTITSKENFIYTENGFYDTKKNLAYFLRKSYIKYKDRRIEADSLYYDRNREYASGTNNVKITDTINKGILKGHFAEIYRDLKTEKDSVIITKRAVAITLVEKDSMYIHGKKILLTGKKGERIVRAFNNVRFYKTDMSGKCDSIHSDQKAALTKLIGRPILWNYENQMTGDVMHLIGNNKTEKLDSLKVLNNAFIVSKDSLGTGYNQVKGQNLYGKFKDNKLYEADVVKNTEVVYYMRNDQNELIGINKNVSSKINMTLDKSTIDTITFFEQVDGDIYPEKDLPENARKLRGFIWRGDERLKSKDDIFPAEENELDAKIQAEIKIKNEKDRIKLQRILDKASDESNGDEIFTEIFKKYNNRIIIDKNGQMLLVKNWRFLFPANDQSFENYKKKHPKYAVETKTDKVLWNWKTMLYGKYDGGLFTGDEEIGGVEYPKKEYLTYEEIFKLYDNRVIMDKNGMKLLVKNGKFKFATNGDSYKLLEKNNARYRTIVRINQVLWDWKTMVYGQYDGGLFTGEEKETISSK